MSPRGRPLLAALLIAGACAAPLPVSTEEALLAADRSWSEAARAGDLVVMATYWAGDALTLFPGASVTRGQQEFLELVQQARNEPGRTHLGWEPLAASLSAAGDVGYTWGTIEVVTADGLGAVEMRTGYYLAVWRVQPDGAWRCVADAVVFGSEGDAVPGEMTLGSLPTRSLATSGR